MEYIVFVSAGVSLFFSGAYALATLRGQVQPNRVTWILWAVAPLIGFFASVSATGFTLGLLPVFMAGFSPLLVVIASFVNKKSYWELRRFDLVCGLFSVLALVIWYLTQNPLVALSFSILSDLLAGLPTLIKSWKYPESESVGPYASGIFSALTSFVAQRSWNFLNLAFPVYLLVLNFTLTMVIWRRKKK